MAERRPSRKWHVGKVIEREVGNKLTIVERLESPFVSVVCDKCHTDEELFPEPLKISIAHLNSGRNPCGCSNNPQWKDWQWEILAKRACEERDLTFLGWEGEYKGSSTLIKLLCNIHDTVNNKMQVTAFVHNESKRGCLECKNELTSKRQSKPLEKSLKDFALRGSYPEGTTFTRISKDLWSITCPACSADSYSAAGCKSEFTAYVSDILNGALSCRCNKTCYRRDEKETVVFLEQTMEEEGLGYKFGGFVDGFKTVKSEFYLLCPNGHKHIISVSGFSNGNRCYECFNKNQTLAYIHTIKDNKFPIAVKYGIESLKGRRLTQQQSKTSLNVETYGYWSFTSNEVCRSAERAVKKAVGTRYLTKQEYPDGYTETARVSDIHRIINIYKSFGGIQL